MTVQDAAATSGAADHRPACAARGRFGQGRFADWITDDARPPACPETGASTRWGWTGASGDRTIARRAGGRPAAMEFEKC
jgi:hypothetical protein